MSKVIKLQSSLNKVTKVRSTLRPLKKNLIVLKLTREQLGKIVLPDSVQDTWFRGRVIAAGPDISTMEIPPTEDGGLIEVKPQIKVGDVVVFSPNRYGDDYKIGDEGHILLNEDMVLAVEVGEI